MNVPTVPSRGSSGGGAAAAGTLTGTTLAANVVNSSLTSFGSGIAAVKTATVTLTDAQIKALPTTAVEIIPAPGVSKVLVPLHAFLIVDAAAGDYTNISGTVDDYSYLAWGAANPFNGRAALGPAVNEDVLSAGRRVALGPFTIRASQNDYPNLYQHGGATNQNLNLVVFNGAGNFTGGHASNTLKVTVWYVEVDV